MLAMPAVASETKDYNTKGKCAAINQRQRFIQTFLTMEKFNYNLNIHISYENPIVTLKNVCCENVTIFNNKNKSTTRILISFPSPTATATADRFGVYYYQLAVETEK